LKLLISHQQMSRWCKKTSRCQKSPISTMIWAACYQMLMANIVCLVDPKVLCSRAHPFRLHGTRVRHKLQRCGQVLDLENGSPDEDCRQGQDPASAQGHATVYHVSVDISTVSWSSLRVDTTSRPVDSLRRSFLRARALSVLAVFFRRLLHTSRDNVLWRL
jgi:hypothetical protein